MSKPVYVLVIGEGWTEAWYQLSKEEQDNLWSKVNEANERAGATLIAGCNARWANESVSGFFILEYPNTDAYQKFKTDALEELNWWRYSKAKTILGTRHPMWES